MQEEDEDGAWIVTICWQKWNTRVSERGILQPTDYWSVEMAHPRRNVLLTLSWCKGQRSQFMPAIRLKPIWIFRTLIQTRPMTYHVKKTSTLTRPVRLVGWLTQSDLCKRLVDPPIMSWTITGLMFVLNASMSFRWWKLFSTSWAFGPLSNFKSLGYTSGFKDYGLVTLRREYLKLGLKHWF